VTHRFEAGTSQTNPEAEIIGQARWLIVNLDISRRRIRSATQEQEG